MDQQIVEKTPDFAPADGESPKQNIQDESKDVKLPSENSKEEQDQKVDAIKRKLEGLDATDNNEGLNLHPVQSPNSTEVTPRFTNSNETFNDDVDKILPSESQKFEVMKPDQKAKSAQKKQPTNVVVDLSGKRIKDDGNRSEIDSDMISQEESQHVENANLVYEKPFPIFSFYNMIKQFMKFSMHQFFKEIIIIGKENVPKGGPVIFCGNHTNQFVDGSIVFFAAPRDTRFMVAAKSFRRPVLGSFFRWSQSVPVERSQDLAKSGVGQVEFEDEITVKGIGTTFLTSFQPGDQIRFIEPDDEPSVEEQIIENIISDTELQLKSPGAKIHNPNIEYKYKVLPKVDQSTVFKHCIEALGKGGSISMFPEGGSHDQTDLLPFKAGIALMTLSTIVETGHIPVIIPTGLKYFKHWEFRSDCIVEFGHPYRPSKKIIDYYKGGQKRKAVAAMLKELEDKMHDVTMTAPSYEELQAIYMARNLYLPKNIQGLTYEQQNEIIQRFSKGYNKMKDDPEIKQLVTAITSYRHMLKLFNVSHDQVSLFKITFLQQVLLMLISFVRLCLSLIFYLPGNIITFPLSTTIAFYTEYERIKALKSSTVKIRANDVRASIKILAYMSTYPMYVIFFTIGFNRLLRWYYEFSSYQTRIYTLYFFILYPIFSIIAIRSHDGVQTHYKNFQGRMLSLFYPGQVQLLQSTRQVLKKKVREQVDKIGPKVFKNFDKMKLIMKDPQLGYKVRSQSFNDDLGDNLEIDENMHKWLDDNEKTLAHNANSRNASRGHSRNNSNSNNNGYGGAAASDGVSGGVSAAVSAAVSAISDYTLTYKEQLDVNNAFNMISNTLGFSDDAAPQQQEQTSAQQKKDN